MVSKGNKPKAIGIDLGTTYSCVAVLVNETVKIIPNEDGLNITPSCVAFTDNERLIGDAAAKQAVFNPKNTVYCTKRFIGRGYFDKEVQDEIESLYYKVSNVDSKPCAEVTYKKEVKKFSPEEIASMILSKLKLLAEQYLGHSVTDAVITVPAYFTNHQRQATKDAGKIAGLNVLQVLSEPTAAAIAFGIENKSKIQKNIFVYDLGGGTFDVSILSIKNCNLDVKSVSGDAHLGGEDFDRRLIDHCLKKFIKKHNVNPSKDLRAMRRLKAKCEEAKRTLSSASSTNIEIDYFQDDYDLQVIITRRTFEELCKDLFERTIQISKKALDDSGIPLNKIDEVILVGGSSRIPKLQELLSDFFNKKTLNKQLNPDEVVAYGAAIQASKLNEDISDLIMELKLNDVTPVSLGLVVEHGLMKVLIPRNTPIPASRTGYVSNSCDYQTHANLDVYEGERALVSENKLFGDFIFTGITPTRRGHSTVEVTFYVDKNGILSVNAMDVLSGKSAKVTMNNSVNHLSQTDIQRMINDSKKFERDDQRIKEQFKAHCELENFAYNLRESLEDNPLYKDIQDRIFETVIDILEWLENNDPVSTPVKVYKDYKSKINDKAALGLIRL